MGAFNALTRFFHDLFNAPLLRVTNVLEAATDKDNFVPVWPRNLSAQPYPFRFSFIPAIAVSDSN